MDSPDDAQLIEMAALARSRAYAPYSGFAVGAAVLGASGQVYLGCNVENSAYPAGMCAERTALVTGVAAGEKAFLRMAVIAGSRRPVPPCGICRLVISELAPNITLVLANLEGETVETKPEQLLPGAFTAADIGR